MTLPTYAFRCDSCHHEFEVETTYSKKGESRCPKCAESSLSERFGAYRLNPVQGGSSAPVPACAGGDPGFT